MPVTSEVTIFSLTLPTILNTIPAMESFLHESKSFEKIIYTSKQIKNKEFQSCTFIQCDFSNSNFSQNRFLDCTFIGCNLSMMKLSRSIVSNASFKECKILGVNFSECDSLLFSVRFENSILDYSSFIGKKMIKTIFKKTSLKNVSFSNAILAGSVFDDSDLSGAIFNKTDLKEANLLTAIGYSIDPELNIIKKACFSLHGIAGLLSKYDIRIS